MKRKTDTCIFLCYSQLRYMCHFWYLWWPGSTGLSRGAHVQSKQQHPLSCDTQILHDLKSEGLQSRHGTYNFCKQARLGQKVLTKRAGCSRDLHSCGVDIPATLIHIYNTWQIHYFHAPVQVLQRHCHWTLVCRWKEVRTAVHQRQKGYRSIQLNLHSWDNLRLHHLKCINFENPSVCNMK